MGEQIVTTVVGGMTGFARGAASIIVDVFDAVFIVGSGAEQTISNFGNYSLTFLGVGIVTGVIGTIVAKVG